MDSARRIRRGWRRLRFVASRLLPDRLLHISSPQERGPLPDWLAGAAGDWGISAVLSTMKIGAALGGPPFFSNSRFPLLFDRRYPAWNDLSSRLFKGFNFSSESALSRVMQVSFYAPRPLSPVSLLPCSSNILLSFGLSRISTIRHLTPTKPIFFNRRGRIVLNLSTRRRRRPVAIVLGRRRQSLHRERRRNSLQQRYQTL